MFYLNKVLTIFILLALPTGIYCADIEKTNLFDHLDQKKIETNQIQHALDFLHNLE